MRILRTRYLLLLLLFAGILGGLLHTAWPFLFYPRQNLSFSFPVQPITADDSTAKAGIAERDITPPAGIPKFGYSAWAKDADGFRTRLKARAFYLKGPGQTPLAIVQLDLGSGSLVLRHRVAELIADHTDVPAHAVTLLVTHTHSGPGQYLGSDFYNVFGSNRAGFDPALFEFFSQRIADAVINAYESRREARFAVGQSDLFGVTHNRAIGAWANNFPEQDPSTADPMQAVNPTMTLLRIDQRRGDRFEPAGALSLYSIHGTAIPPFTRPYHADVWHWISEQLESELASDYPQFIHGPAQATHADNNPAWKEGLRGDREAERIGKALGKHASQLFHSLESQLTDTLNTAVASRQLDLLDDIDPGRFGLCERAIAGASVAGAANGDEVFPISYLPFLKENWPRRVFSDNCQGAKQWMLSKLQLLLPAERFPHQALFQIVRINDLVVVPLPWEITLESGNRLRQAVASTLPEGSDWKVEISSLANGYFGYAVTPEEYALQYYEGGHTLYGPHTLDFLIQQSERLSRELQQQGDINDIPAQQTFSLLSRQYFPDSLASPGTRRWLSEPTRHDGDATTGPYWSLLLEAEPADQLALDRPLMAVHCDDKVISDDSAELQLLHQQDTEKGHGRYEVRWYPTTPSPSGACRFFVSTNQPQAVLSAPLP
ncbi:MAG: hypothetical protein CL539_06420 [Alcanivorax sp.]|uniref:neutral/alkaline non-lysosomal ceramidase N-terminal domain-containing protein n=1 Tax=Alcanivorax sp. TaxID=1872427 RepID=UPI000C94959F|nr:neutral/alkaline non-lysosomal ceramidase N-terminal domain-containing protein [Alcanivorax sp.]MAC14300.1 hypothetical protein [Alcanivorax sp.]